MDTLNSAYGVAQRRNSVFARYPLAFILVAALLLRLAVVPIMGIHHPDELWQYLEPAHELVFGRGVDAWEFRVGIRTWIVPFVIAPFMWLGDTLVPSGLLYIYLPKAMLALLSLTIVWSWWQLGLRVSPRHAVIAAFIAAVWMELIHFAARPLSEPISMALFFPAAVILTKHKLARKQLVLAGFLLGLTFCVRFQLAPALLCLVVCTQWRRLHHSMPWLAAGGFAALALDGLIDFSAGEMPFRWIVENFRVNLIEDKSSEYGRARGYYYFLMPFQRWSGAVGPILILAAVGGRRFPVLALVALVNLAVHSLIPHKEFRFVLLSFEIAIFLAAIGTADAINLARSHRGLWAGLACATWTGVSLAVAFLDPLSGAWFGSKDVLQTLQVAGNSSKVCGLATFELEQPLSVAYTYYHRDTPMFGFKGDVAGFQKHQDRFNVVIAHPAMPPGGAYAQVQCSKLTPWHQSYCVYLRPGACSSVAAPEYEMNHFLASHGK